VRPPAPPPPPVAVLSCATFSFALGSNSFSEYVVCVALRSNVRRLPTAWLPQAPRKVGSSSSWVLFSHND